MLTMTDRLNRSHRFLARRGLYPIILSSLLAIGLFASRAYLVVRLESNPEASFGRALTYAFLVWNLFLAWIPYLSSLWAAHIHQRFPSRWWYLLIPSALWLIFFPNAPYIVTDFLHLRARAPIPFWYDVGMLTVFAWTGLFLAVFSLRTMQTLVKNFLGTVASWLFVLGSLGLGGLGVYIGRFLRWNSWDLLLHPHNVLADVIIRLANPLNHPGTLGVTFMFAAFLLVCYLTFTIIPSPEYPPIKGGDRI
jgi:uncharacterized membrane protein